jgi:hypothetical protein
LMRRCCLILINTFRQVVNSVLFMYHQIEIHLFYVTLVAAVIRACATSGVSVANCS